MAVNAKVYAMDFPERLRMLMAERDISQRALAGKVPCSPAHISFLARALAR